MQSQLGLAHFWSQGDLVTHTTAAILALLSLASWSVIISKLLSTWRASRSQDRALTGFWHANSLPEALEGLRKDDPSGIFSGLALTGAHAAQSHQQNATRGIGAGVNASEFITRSMRSHIVNTQARNERGLTLLASVGSTAPFIGLFGTVWGIYHALVGLSGATQVVLDKVAGPVGEALIMTAAGLFVAIPAVLAYNAFTRANRLVSVQLDGFAHDLHAYLTTGARVGSNPNLVELGAVRASRQA
ncbi:MotA/TolQ/ExbB proton channel family protein [Dechloromonas agitata]|uniref:MotA/TolQ/ExbB proton channel family protein n=1 Tax=Dechloromonas agitata TaxID=73030 RepID=UPI00048096BD|nr:MotA/TolQ/ExbB proton channel family protein [Dechloromonas agitata]MDE1544325.1 MotA/TolQ/ExbB proton channel family protein [Dechloromonas agitata]